MTEFNNWFFTFMDLKVIKHICLGSGGSFNNHSESILLHIYHHININRHIDYGSYQLQTLKFVTAEYVIWGGGGPVSTRVLNPGIPKCEQKLHL